MYEKLIRELLLDIILGGIPMTERAFHPRRLSFGPIKVSKMGDKAIILVPKPLRPYLLGKRVIVNVVILD